MMAPVASTLVLYHMSIAAARQGRRTLPQRPRPNLPPPPPLLTLDVLGRPAGHGAPRGAGGTSGRTSCTGDEGLRTGEGGCSRNWPQTPTARHAPPSGP